MKMTIETIDFPCEVKTKLKMKVSATNLKFEFLSGHIIKFNKTNLSVREPHKIIVNNDNQVLLFERTGEMLVTCILLIFRF